MKNTYLIILNSFLYNYVFIKNVCKNIFKCRHRGIPLEVILLKSYKYYEKYPRQ